MSYKTTAMLGLLVASTIACLTATAHAQPIDWWTVVPLGVGEDTDVAQRAAEQVVTALKDRRVPVMSMHQARDRFERTSREPRELDPTDIDLLAKDAYEAVRQVAFGNRQAAARTVAQVMQRAERAMETLNRETKNARYVLDACLALVRSTMARHDREGALAEAMRCRRIVPDVTPSELMHPPSVIGILAEADDQLRRMQIGHLTVESVPESGCSVYLNGRHLGTTPFKLRRAAAGEYRVQVECGETPGRVHDVELGDKPVQIVVDTLFDQAVRTRPTLQLQYPSARAQQRRMLDDAVTVATSTGAYEVVLASQQDATHVRLTRVASDQPRVLGEAVVSWRGSELDPDSLDAGIDALLAGRTLGAAEEPARANRKPRPRPVAVAPVAPTETQPPAEPVVKQAPKAPREPWTQRQTQLRLGLPLAAAGVATLAAGWGLYARAEDLRDLRDALEPPAQITDSVVREEALRRSNDYADARRLPAIAFAGGALAAAAMPFLLPEVEGIPWYAWVSGAAGAGLAAVGFWQLAGNGACLIPVDGTCRRTDDHLPLMSVSFATALPLLAVPVTFALRMPFAKRGEARVGAVPLRGGSALSVQGVF